MKKLSVLILTVIMCFSFFGCEEKVEKITLNDFDELLKNQPLAIVESELFVQLGNRADKRLYPDMLTVTFQNRTNKVINLVEVAFVAWDKNGNPVAIQQPNDEKKYDIKAIRYTNLNLESGRYYGKGMGIELAQNHNIASFKAIVVKFKCQDGTVWENPYFDVFKNNFVSKQFYKSMMLSCEEKEEKLRTLSKLHLEKTVLDEATLKEKMAELSVEIVSSEYVVRGDDKDTAPDVLKTVFKNKGEKELSSVKIGLFGFDENGKAVKIREAGDNASPGNYLTLIEYSTNGFVKDTTFGENDLFEVNENCGIKYVVAFVKSYTNIDGTTVENPYFYDICLIYEGKGISVEIPENETNEPIA